jgi:serine/threonine protein kinase
VYRDRLSDHRAVAAALGSMSTAELISIIERADGGRISIGGSTQSIRVADTPVFVKLVRLTDRELRAGPECTANLFDLPTWYQYGVGPGSTGFNAWREVAAHQICNDWVLDGACANFPMLYHWRVLPGLSSGPTAALSADVDDAVRFWGSSPAVESRLRALDGSSTVVALFLEYVPYALRDWLREQLTAGSVQAETAVTLVDQQLLRAVRHMRSSGMAHFDGHFDNVLTDGHRVYLSDFGLASAQRFPLDSSEQSFLRLTADHDLAYCATALVNTITAASLKFPDPTARNDYIRRTADTGRATALDGVLANTVVRYAPVAKVVNDFYWKLHDGNVTAEYPADLLATALQGAGISGQD